MSPAEVGALYAQHQPGLIRFLTTQVSGDVDEAPDLAHATWTHFCAVTSARVVVAPAQFLFRVARWKAAKHRRFRGRTGRLLRTLPPPGREHEPLTPVSGSWKTRRLTGSEARATGEAHGRARYADAEGRRLRVLYLSLGSYRAVARHTGMSRETVRRFLTGIRKVR